jgi:hypothetical protein
MNLPDEILARMKAQRDLLDAAIRAYEAYQGAAARTPAAPPALPVDRSAPSVSASGALRGLTFRAAVKQHLGIHQQQTTAEIVAGLKNGGIESASQNFSKRVSELLRQMRDKGEIIRFGERWTLAATPPAAAPAAPAETKKPKPLDAATRKRISEAMKKRWAATRANKRIK